MEHEYIRQVCVVGRYLIVYMTVTICVPKATASIITSEPEFEDEPEG